MVIGDDRHTRFGNEVAQTTGIVEVAVNEGQVVESFFEHLVSVLDGFVESPRRGFEDFNAQRSRESSDVGRFTEDHHRRRGATLNHAAREVVGEFCHVFGPAAAEPILGDVETLERNDDANALHCPACYVAPVIGNVEKWPL